MINVEQTIISQYGNSATITQLIRNMDQYLDPRSDFDAFYNFVWNVDTAQGFGLDIWGRIVNIGRNLLIPEDPDEFGFDEADTSAFPFDDAPFYSGLGRASLVYRLGDDAYRQLILVKALANITAVNAPSLNQLLQNLFAGRGRAYVIDNYDMTITYTFDFFLEPFEIAILTQSGAMPRPAGVQFNIFNAEPPLFGFQEAGDSSFPFDDGVFLNEGAII